MSRNRRAPASGPVTKEQFVRLEELQLGYPLYRTARGFNCGTIDPPSYDGLTIKTLMDICGAVECSPEELFFNFDQGTGGGCETCGYGADEFEWEFQIRRAKEPEVR